MPPLTRDAFKSETYRISSKKGGAVGFDFETTGLNPYKGAYAFILGWADETGKYSYPIQTTDAYWIGRFFSNKDLHYSAHNAKFELSFLRHQFCVEVQGTIWDSEVNARIAYDKPINKGTSFSLQACAQRIGQTKLPEALEWLEKNGKSDYRKMPMVEDYVEQDAWLSWELRRVQIETFKHWDISGEHPIHRVVSLESRVLKPLFEMESRGLLVDLNYCKRALEHEQNEMAQAKKEFEKLTGKAFIDSAKTLLPIFLEHGLNYGKTEKGNPSFDLESVSQSLKNRENPIVQALLQFRTAQKRASTYWTNFIEFADENAIIHPNIHQNRAATGRMSVTEPACQTWPTDDDDQKDEGPYPIRKAFHARNERFIVSLDYQQMELRLSADEAGDHKMIEAFKKGTDFHKEVALSAGVPRSLAKPARFAKAYGAGVKRVAETLKVDLALAGRICAAIDESAPRCAAYAWELINYVKRFPYGFNFLGRRYYFDKGFEYKYPNYRIQGGGSEILKQAIVAIDKLLQGTQSYMLLPVHDELILDMPKQDFHLIPKIKDAMIAAYKPRFLPMDVSVCVGKNMHDMEEYGV